MPDSRQYFGYTDFGEREPITRDEWELLKDTAGFSCFKKCTGGVLFTEGPEWRGPVTQDRDNWTPWSGAIGSQGARLALSKGQYFQVLVTMVSREPTEVARLDSMSVEVLPLLVPTVVGEVATIENAATATLTSVPLGEPTALTYAIRADFEGQRLYGFDAIHITTPSRPEFMHLMRGDPLEEVPVPDDSIQVEEDGLTVFLSSPVDQNEELRVGLRTTLYTVSEKLLGEVYVRAADNVRQVIDEGNAGDELASDQLQIVAEDNIPAAIADLRVEPRTVTPNGDGRNDELMIRYSLFGVLDADVELGIYTLAGQPVRRMTMAGQDAGVSPPVMWNGADDSGKLVVPGVYLCQVVTETSRGRFANTITVSVAY